MIATNDFDIGRAREDWIDEVVAESFPASDPPPWTPGIAMLRPSTPASVRPTDKPTDMLKPGDAFPHITITDLGGRCVDYSSIWQRKNLVLVLLSDTGSSSQSHADQLLARASDAEPDDTAWLVTRDSIAGLPRPGSVVADRWGEVMHVAHAKTIAHLPTFDELLEWVEHVRHRCPECEGEAR